MLRKLYIWWSCQEQPSGQNHNIKISNKSFEVVAYSRYLGTMPTHQKSVHQDIRSRLKSVNHSVQNVVSFSFLFKNTKIKIYRTAILPVILSGCETLSLTLRVFGNRVLRYLDLKEMR